MNHLPHSQHFVYTQNPILKLSLCPVLSEAHTVERLECPQTPLMDSCLHHWYQDWEQHKGHTRQEAATSPNVTKKLQTLLGKDTGTKKMGLVTH